MAKQKSIIVFFLLVLLISSGIFFWYNYLPKENQEAGPIKPGKPKITVFYSPTCSCCKTYIAYLRRNDFKVEALSTHDMLSIKEKYQIPSEMESCHTSVIGDYFIEGHMPIEAINKLLEEKPEISGISLPGMPVGSPGMGGVKRGLFTIYGLRGDQVLEFGKF